MAWAVVCMAMVSALYEPVRQALLERIEPFIGGVGGVGGLANLAGPSACVSSNENATTPPQPYHGEYCYQPGVGGGPFTPFAYIMMALWVGPFLAGAMAMMFCRAVLTTTASPSPPPSLDIFALVWMGLNMLWFAVPLASFGTGLSSVHVSQMARGVLAVSLAASHPLSWNLMVVAMPASGVTSHLLGCTRETLFLGHRFIAYGTGFWALLHGGGEILYLVMTKAPKNGTTNHFISVMTLQGDGEDLIYVLGLICLVILIVHVAVASFRKTLASRGISCFRTIHRTLAFVFLLAASCHWWPLVLFLLPSLALHGISIAYFFYCDKNVGRSLCSIPVGLSSQQIGCLVALSTVASFFGTYAAWVARQNYMIKPTANLYVPFVFPAVSVLSSLVASVLASSVYLRVNLNNTQDNTTLDPNNNATVTSPLLDDGGHPHHEESVHLLVDHNNDTAATTSSGAERPQGETSTAYV
jgi:hypothetical protein